MFDHRSVSNLDGACPGIRWDSACWHLFVCCTLGTTVALAADPVTISAVQAVESKSSVSLAGVANDGLVAVGHEEFWPTGLWTSLEWTPDGGASHIAGEGPMLGLPSGAEAVSADGLAIVGGAYFDDFDADAYRWSPWGGYENLGHPIEFDSSWSSGVSSDGGVVVGNCGSWMIGDSGFRWTEEHGMELLEALPDAAESVVYAVSGDGVFAVGESGGQACRWNGTTPEALGVLVDQTTSTAIAVDLDGSVVVGDSGPRAFRWTEAAGMQDLGVLPGAASASAYAVSGDGTIVVGESGFRAFVWTEELGMVDLAVHLEQSFGVDLSGHDLRRASAISADGTAIAGQGNGLGWVVRGLPPVEDKACRADLDHDGAVDAADLSILLSAWNGDCCGADLDGDGIVDSIDLTILLASWDADCSGM